MELLSTKLFAPPARPDLVQRPQLIQKLDQGLLHARPLSLISAPAGYGKTTLVTSWLAERRSSPGALPDLSGCAWLSLDDDDNDLIRFAAYLTTALEEAGIIFPPEIQKGWEINPLPSAEKLVTVVLNSIKHHNNVNNYIIVLDDYHKIQTSKIHEALQYWLDHPPPNVHLVIVTREDPPLTLSRWRAGNRMTEIRAADLRFDRSEAATFLQKTMMLALPEKDVATLEQRTEGWVAGLQLAALALQASSTETDQHFAADFIADFGSTHHYIIDYLVEEVLRQQKYPVREFLRQTAVLDRLTPALCNAVTGRSDSQAMLTSLERRNLFLIPLDHEQRWYRYHHLFSESLRITLDDVDQAELHHRAALWYQSNGFTTAAVRHALATGDLNFAAETMEEVIQKASAWSRGQVARLTSWLEALPDHLLQKHPALCLHASRALYLTGDMNQAEKLLHQAEAGLSPKMNDIDSLTALATVYRAALSAIRGENLAETIAATTQLLQEPLAVDLHTAARTADTLGLAYELRGEVEAAERAYWHAGELAGKAGVRYLAINARCEAALMQIEQGCLTKAVHSCREALEAAENEDIPPTGLAWAILGKIAFERNELEKAKRFINKGIALSQAGGINDDLRYAYLFLAHYQQALADNDAALAAWQQADYILRGTSIPRLTSLSAAHRVRLDLAQGKHIQVFQWAQRYQEQKDNHTVEYQRDFEELTLARVLAETKEFSAALTILDTILASSQASGRLRTVIESQFIRARVLHALKRPDAAKEAVQTALAFAVSEGFSRLCHDEGAALRPFISEIRPEMAVELVDQLPDVYFQKQRKAGRAQFSKDLSEPLSNRELEILQLVAAGESNKEIAKKLVITVGTTKWHVHNIYEKLGISGRAEAVAYAFEHNLVDR